ncbi:MAG: hypothetical protein LBS58_01870 [Coriobacteriales bacterium]|jgi:hypothetical protein|nr:hypothetical protein [Coriobacteriales bacterium]
MVEQASGTGQALVAEDEQQLWEPVSEEVSHEDFAVQNLPEELSFEAKAFRACELLQANPLNRTVLYRILVACASKRILLHDLEGYILEQPEFKGATQPPYFLIDWLVDYSALDVAEIDHEGNDIAPEQKEGLSEDEVDDLIDDFAFSTSEVGKAVIEEFSPRNRLIDLLGIVPERYDTYVEVLELLTEKRPLSVIDGLLRGRDVLMSGRKPGENPMQPSVFVDKLADAGGIIYDGGWQITPEGKELLEAIKDRRG